MGCATSLMVAETTGIYFPSEPQQASLEKAGKQQKATFNANFERILKNLHYAWSQRYNFACYVFL